MATICGPITATISYVSQSVCGHIVKINDIKPLFGTIDVQVDSQIIPGVGSVSVALAPDFTTRANINLVNKNTAAGTATISISIETIDVPPVSEATHYLDIYVKPHSWYTIGSAADSIVTKLADINGAILNLFTSVGISDYKYLGTEILTEADKPDLVTIRLHLQQLSALGIRSMAVPLLVYIAAIIAAILVIIILIGVITGWKFTLAGLIQQITGKNYSGAEVGTLLKGVLDDNKANCQHNFPSDPIGYANCVKSGVQSVTKAGGDFFKDDSITQSGNQAATNIDNCITQYNAGAISATDLANCTNQQSDNSGSTIVDKTKNQTGDLTGTLILGAFLLGGLYIISKGAGEVARPVLIERERLRAGG